MKQHIDQLFLYPLYIVPLYLDMSTVNYTVPSCSAYNHSIPSFESTQVGYASNDLFDSWGTSDPGLVGLPYIGQYEQLFTVWHPCDNNLLFGDFWTTEIPWHPNLEDYVDESEQPGPIDNLTDSISNISENAKWFIVAYLFYKTLSVGEKAIPYYKNKNRTYRKYKKKYRKY